MNFRTQVAHVADVDVDVAVLDNPFLDSAAIIRMDDGRIPYDDGAFDVVFSDNVLEHLRDPVATLCEVRRVLKPGGVFLAKTPNKWHYMPLVARATPLWFHRFYNRMRGRSESDTFPTVYRCNTRGAVTRVAEAAGMGVEDVVFIEGRPEYLRIAAPTYFLGWLYERFVNSSARFAPLRSVMQVTLRARSRA
jgi:SAM-dependent methyltransferase